MGPLGVIVGAPTHRLDQLYSLIGHIVRPTHTHTGILSSVVMLEVDFVFCATHLTVIITVVD